MSTYVDFSYRIDGTAADLAIARTAILDFQAECQGWDGMEDVPVTAEDGSLRWSGYTTMDIEPFDRKMANLTRGKAMRVWAYQGCTDGCCESGLSLFEKGSFCVVDRWEADIGIRSALAAIELSNGSDINATLILIDRVKIGCRDGWDGDDWTHLLAAGVCTLLVAQAVNEYPELLKSSMAAEALMGVCEDMRDARKDLRKFKAMDKTAIKEIDGLLAAIEGLEIGAVAKTCQPAKRLTVRI